MRALLAEALRLLRPGGAVCITLSFVPHEVMRPMSADMIGAFL